MVINSFIENAFELLDELVLTNGVFLVPGLSKIGGTVDCKSKGGFVLLGCDVSENPANGLPGWLSIVFCSIESKQL